MGVSVDADVAGNFLSLENQSTGIFSGGAESHYPLTMSAWVRYSGFTQETMGDDGGTIVSISRGTGGNHFLILMHDRNATNTAADAIARAAGTTSRSAPTTGEPLSAADTWYLLVGTFVGTLERNIFVNGSATTGQNTQDATPTGLDSITIGAIFTSGSTNQLIGDVAHVAIWTGELDNTEIDALVNTDPSSLSTATSGATLVHHWPLDDDFVDDVGSLTLTENGTVAFTGDSPYAEEAGGTTTSFPGPMQNNQIRHLLVR